MRHTITAGGALLFFILTGGAWISLSGFLPDGISRDLVIVGLGVAFVAVFLYQLVVQLRELLSPEQNWQNLLLVVCYLTLLLLAFAWMYQIVGITNNVGSPPEETTSFLTSIYYSIVTFTTLGYGDFVPTGIGRFLAALQALTGYIILGVLASVAASLISPHQKPSLINEEEEQ